MLPQQVGPRIDGKLLERVAAPDAEGRKLLTAAAERMRLSAAAATTG